MRRRKPNAVADTKTTVTNEQSQKRSISPVAIVLVCFGILAALLIWSGRFARYQSLGTIQWCEKNEGCASKIAALGIPLLVKGTPADKWAAKKWTPSYVESKSGGTLHHLYSKFNNSFFPYFHQKPMSNIPGIDVHGDKYDFTTEITARDFFEGMMNPKPNKKRHYYSNELHVDFKHLMSQVDPTPFIVDEGATLSTNIWLGGAGTITHMHNDGDFNFYVQLYGSKVWYIYPPWAHEELLQFPHIHPRHQQSFLDFRDTAVGDFRPFGSQAYRVEVKAGDVLYIPPLWFHHVITVTPSVAINMWSAPKKNDDVHMKYDLFAAGCLKPDAGNSEKVASLALLGGQLVTRVLGQNHVAPFFQNIYWGSRARPIYETVEVFQRTKDYQDMCVFLKDVTQERANKMFEKMQPCVKHVAATAYSYDFSKELASISLLDQLKHGSQYRHPKVAAAEIAIASYLDTVSLWAVEAIRMPVFARAVAECLPPLQYPQ